MGSRLLANIPQWNGGTGLQPAGVSVPVGSVRARDEVTLTHCVVDDQARVQFGDEIGATGERVFLWRDRPLECRASDMPPQEAIKISTLELETRRRELRGSVVIACLRPYAQDWFAWAQFKRVKRLSRSENDETIRKIVARARAQSSNVEMAVWSEIVSAETDMFGSEDYHYARIRTLVRTDDYGRAADDDWLGRQSIHEGTKANRRALTSGKQPLELSFGVCEQFAECRDLLRVSPILQDAVDQAHDGTGIAFGGETFQLTPSAQALARPVWESAIVKALAGPGDRQKERLRALSRESARWGGPAVLARCIFEDSLRSLNDRHDEIRVTLGSLDQVRGRAAPNDELDWPRPGTPVDGATAKRLIDRVSTVVDRVPPDEYPIAWSKIERLLASPDPDCVQAGVVVAAALASRDEPPQHLLQRLSQVRADQDHALLVDAVLPCGLLGGGPA